MKKFGFTLAEVLVTLGVIGVVAAMTIPSISANANNKAFAAKLSTTITNLETAFSNMMVDEGLADFSEIEDFSNISKFIKIVDSNINVNDYGDIKFINGLNEPFSFKNPIFMLKSGAIFTRIGLKELYIDVNGKDKPNIIGRDVFYFILDEEGKIHPIAGKVYADTDADKYWETTSNDRFKCDSSNKAFGCVARLVENNFVVDY